MMNDFTKEELEFLKHSVREHYKNNRPIKGSTYMDVWAKMIKKIQSMIDNYCEHECSGDGECLTKICHRCVRLVG